MKWEIINPQKVFYILLIILFPEMLLAQITFQKPFGGIGDERGHSVKQTFDGGYVIAGYTSGFGAGDKDYIVIKTDSLGNVQWTKTYGGSGEDEGNSVSIQQTADSGYIVTGWTYSFGSSNKDIYIL